MDGTDDGHGTADGDGIGVRDRLREAGRHAVMAMADETRAHPRGGIPVDNAALALALAVVPGPMSGAFAAVSSLATGEGPGAALGTGLGLAAVLTVEMALCVGLLEILWMAAGSRLRPDGEMVRRSLAFPFALMTAGAFRFLWPLPGIVSSLMMAAATVAVIVHAVRVATASGDMAGNAVFTRAVRALAPACLGIVALSTAMWLGSSVGGMAFMFRLPGLLLSGG